MILYSDIDPKCCAWITELIRAGEIPRGDVWCKPIQEIQPNDLRPYHQCHFFCGVGGFPLALKLCGWPAARPVATGSPPCQPLSGAGKGLGELDERHLWPEYHHLIKECRFPTVLGEQTASDDGLEWLDGVFLDLEDDGYAVAASDLPAASVGAPHTRQRIFFAAHADGDGGEGLWLPPPIARQAGPWGAYSKMALLAGDVFEPGPGWPAPLVRVLDDGLSYGVELLRGYGNAIVPQVAAAFIQAAEAARADLNGLPHLHVRVEPEPVSKCRIFNFDEA